MTLATQPLYDTQSNLIGTLGYQLIESNGNHNQDKPTLVFIHGVGLQSCVWQAQIEHFKQDFCIYAIDMPAHGLSSAIDSTGNINDYVLWLHNVFHTLNIKKANLIGHSMGALLSMGYTINYPQKVERVALINSVYCRSKITRAAVVARANEIHNGPIDIDTPLQRWFDNSPEQQTMANTVGNWLANIDSQGYAKAYKAFATGDAMYAQKLPNITCPAVAITGSDDPNSTPDMSQAIANNIPQCEAFIIAGHRHMVTMTAANKINQILRQWLQTNTTHPAGS